MSYAQNDTGACTHAQRTSQCVESLNAKLLPHRKKTPLLALESLVLSLQHDYKTASEAMNAKIKARENDGIATNISDFYHGLFTSQVLQLGRFVANRKNDDIKGYVQRRGEPSARFNIDLRQKIPCNCGFTAKHRIDCVHTLIFRLAGNASILLNKSTYFADFYPKYTSMIALLAAYDRANLTAPIIKNFAPPEAGKEEVLAPEFEREKRAGRTQWMRRSNAGLEDPRRNAGRRIRRRKRRKKESEEDVRKRKDYVDSTGFVDFHMGSDDENEITLAMPDLAGLGLVFENEGDERGTVLEVSATSKYFCLASRVGDGPPLRLKRIDGTRLKGMGKETVFDEIERSLHSSQGFIRLQFRGDDGAPTIGRSIEVEFEIDTTVDGVTTTTAEFVPGVVTAVGDSETTIKFEDRNVEETTNLDQERWRWASAPGTSAPETSAPGSSAPESSAPESSALVTSAPETLTLGTSAPAILSQAGKGKPLYEMSGSGKSGPGNFTSYGLTHSGFTEDDDAPAVVHPRGVVWAGVERGPNAHGVPTFPRTSWVSERGLMRKDVLYALTPAQRDEAMALIRSSDANLGKTWRLAPEDLSFKSLSTLDPDENRFNAFMGPKQENQHGSWLNDEVINIHMATLQIADEALGMSNNQHIRSHFFPGWFYSKLVDTENTGQYTYNNVRRWWRKVHGENVFNLKVIGVPINQGNQHWSCMAALVEKKELRFYDSMGRSGKREMGHFLCYLADEHRRQNLEGEFDKSEWTLVECDTAWAANAHPQQDDCFNCGVFVCMCLSCIAAGLLNMPFDHRDCTDQRLRMALHVGSAAEARDTSTTGTGDENNVVATVTRRSLRSKILDNTSGHTTAPKTAMAEATVASLKSGAKEDRGRLEESLELFAALEASLDESGDFGTCDEGSEAAHIKQMEAALKSATNGECVSVAIPPDGWCAWEVLARLLALDKSRENSPTVPQIRGWEVAAIRQRLDALLERHGGVAVEDFCKRRVPVEDVCLVYPVFGKSGVNDEAIDKLLNDHVLDLYTTFLKSREQGGADKEAFPATVSGFCSSRLSGTSLAEYGSSFTSLLLKHEVSTVRDTDGEVHDPFAFAVVVVEGGQTSVSKSHGDALTCSTIKGFPVDKKGNFRKMPYVVFTSMAAGAPHAYLLCEYTSDLLEGAHEAYDAKVPEKSERSKEAAVVAYEEVLRGQKEGAVPSAEGGGEKVGEGEGEGGGGSAVPSEMKGGVVGVTTRSKGKGGAEAPTAEGGPKQSQKQKRRGRKEAARLADQFTGKNTASRRQVIWGKDYEVSTDSSD